ncbi:hypothetical protein JL720_15195 [Aureococcus anophagefferens]|nr:hypothetical protein JL720_15195 [Aureococcus anophagefferens]
MGAKHAALLLALATYATPLSLKAVHREFKVKDASVISKVTYDAARERQPVLIFLSGADVPHEKYAWLAEGLAARGIATCGRRARGLVVRGANHASCARPPEPACGAAADLATAPGFDAAAFEASFCDLVAAHVLGGDLAAVATDAALHLSTAVEEEPDEDETPAAAKPPARYGALEAFVAAAQRAVAKDEDIDVDVTLHVRFGDYMASKPSVDFDGAATRRAHAA